MSKFLREKIEKKKLKSDANSLESTLQTCRCDEPLEQYLHMVLGEQFTLKEKVSVPLPDLFPVSHFQPSEHCLSRGKWPPIHVAAAQN